jgi:uncharacterized protein (DUF433 family)
MLATSKPYGIIPLVGPTISPLCLEYEVMVHERIDVDPKVMFGKPVIKGTRITVELILRKLAEGMTYEQILSHHPHLTVEDIRAAAAFAADHLANEQIVVASGETL